MILHCMVLIFLCMSFFLLCYFSAFLLLLYFCLFFKQTFVLFVSFVLFCFGCRCFAFLFFLLYFYYNILTFLSCWFGCCWFSLLFFPLFFLTAFFSLLSTVFFILSWVKLMLFYLLRTVATLIFAPCVIPCVSLCKVIGEERGCSPTKAGMEGFRTVAHGFLLLNSHVGS